MSLCLTVQPGPEDGEHLNPSDNSSGIHQVEHNTETCSNDILSFSSSEYEDSDLGLIQFSWTLGPQNWGRPLRTPIYLRDYVK